ncbi:MAG: hypothetical protein C0518_06260 [Opitutus sp.]|nr:hypothetical protein [Opitutus sp.]
MQYTAFFRQLREQKGLSHEALARLARVHRNTVVNVEGGRPVKFATLARLVTKMGYASDSPELASLALLWLESLSGLDLADPARLGLARQKIATYQRSTNRATASLTETVRRAGLREGDIRLLELAARRPELLAILRSICDLLPAADSADEAPVLRAAEDK